VSLRSASSEGLQWQSVADFHRANRVRCFWFAGGNKPEESGGLKRRHQKHSFSVSFRLCNISLALEVGVVFLVRQFCQVDGRGERGPAAGAVKPFCFPLDDRAVDQCWYS
jgi:hypothetical protein